MRSRGLGSEAGQHSRTAASPETTGFVLEQGLTVEQSGRLPRGVLAGAAYFVLGMADMGLSSTAFVLGIREANPVLAWLTQHGLFVPAKLALTAAVAGLIVWGYPRGRVRPVVWVALVTMAAVNVYHVWGLGAL